MKLLIKQFSPFPCHFISVMSKFSSQDPKFMSTILTLQEIVV
jgi:hypothetical protein